MDGVSDRLGRAPLQIRDTPVFDELTNRARADEGGDVDHDTRLVRHVDNGLDVANDRSRGAIGTNAESIACDRPCQSKRIRLGTSSCRRKAEIEHVEPKILHQMEQTEFVFERGIANRW